MLRCQIPAEWINLVEFLDQTPVNSKQIAEETSKCSVLKEITKFLRHGWPEKVSNELKPYFLRQNELSLQPDCILWGNRIIIPKTLQQKILDELHVSHPGICRMKDLARSYLWWPNLDLEIERFVRSCKECHVLQNNPKSAPLHPWEWPESPWHRLHIDYAGPFNDQYFLVIVDAHTKWVESFPTNSMTAATTINCLRSCFARFGVPVSLVSDSSFLSEEFKTFMSNNGIRHITSAVYSAIHQRMVSPKTW